MPIIYRTAYRITSEKQSRVRESMRIMGLSDSAYWLSWFAYFLVLQIVISSLVTAIIHLGNIIPNASVFIIWLVVFLFGMHSFGTIITV